MSITLLKGLNLKKSRDFEIVSHVPPFLFQQLKKHEFHAGLLVVGISSSIIESTVPTLMDLVEISTFSSHYF